MVRSSATSKWTREKLVACAVRLGAVGAAAVAPLGLSSTKSCTAARKVQRTTSVKAPAAYNALAAASEMKEVTRSKPKTPRRSPRVQR